jgi:hypothetical protein
MRVPTPPPFEAHIPSTPISLVAHDFGTLVLVFGSYGVLNSESLLATPESYEVSASEDACHEDHDPRSGYIDTDVPSAHDLLERKHRDIWRTRIRHILDSEGELNPYSCIAFLPLFTYPLMFQCIMPKLSREVEEVLTTPYRLSSSDNHNFVSAVNMSSISVFLMICPVFSSALDSGDHQVTGDSQQSVQSAIVEASNAFFEASNRRRELLDRQMVILRGMDLIQQRCTYY